MPSTFINVLKGEKSSKSKETLHIAEYASYYSLIQPRFQPHLTPLFSLLEMFVVFGIMTQKLALIERDKYA